HFGAHRANDFLRETGAIFQRTAVFIVALVGTFPEELVDQVTVGAVDLDTIKTQRLGIARRFGKGTHHILDVLARHHMADHLARLVHAARAVDGHGLGRANAGATHGADMPDLRNDTTTGLMHRIDHLLPAIQRRAMKRRHLLVAIGRLVVDGGAFGNQQADAGLGAATVIANHFVVRDVVRRAHARHRRHGNTVGELQRLAGERAKQGGHVSAHGISGSSGAARPQGHRNQTTTDQRNLVSKRNPNPIRLLFATLIARLHPMTTSASKDSPRESSRQRLHDDPCSVARALSDVGDWWSLLIVRQAMYGTRRYSDSRYQLRIARNILVDRLAKLVDNDIFKKVDVGAPGQRYGYRTTCKGKDLFTVLVALRQWG